LSKKEKWVRCVQLREILNQKQKQIYLLFFNIYIMETAIISIYEVKDLIIIIFVWIFMLFLFTIIWFQIWVKETRKTIKDSIKINIT